MASAETQPATEPTRPERSDAARRARVHAIGAAALFGLVALGAVYSAYGAVKDFAYARASGRWPTAEAVILSPRRGRADEFRYAYHFGGESYEGERIAFRTRGYIGSPPPTTPGALAPVYVRPDDPATAVLVPGGSGRRFAVWLALSGLGVFVGVAGLTRAMMALDFPEELGLSDMDDATAADGVDAGPIAPPSA